MAYEYEDKVVNILKTFGVLYNSNINFIMAEEVSDVYTKARAFDEIVAEFGHYVDTLQSWESIDHKDTQTLLEIIRENMEDK